MSNNISRKGLALGALLAIGASLFAGAPAHAAAGISLTAYSTSQNLSVPTGTSFQLLETSSAEIPNTSWDTLAVKVTTNNASAVVVTVGSRTSKTTAATAGESVTFKSTDVSMGVRSNNQTVEVRGSASTTTTATVTVWLDSNANGAIDSGEYSASQTVTFLGAADLTATTSFLKSPTYTSDARTVQVRTALTNVNTDQLALNSNDGYGLAAGHISVDLRSGTYDARQVPTATPWNGAVVAASADARAFYAIQSAAGVGGPYTSVTSGNAGGVELSSDARVWFSGAVFTAQAYWDGVAIGNKASTASGLVNNAATSISIDTVKGANAALKSSGNAAVRLNSAFQVSATIRGDATSNLSGVGVKFAVSTADWVTNTVRVTVNGTTYANSADLRAASWTIPADAAGNALLNVSVAGSNVDTITNYNDLTFTATSANLATVNVTVKQTKAVASALAATPDSQAVVLGSAATVSATVKDQFGQLASDSNLALQVSYASGVGSSASGAFTPVVNGAATAKVTVDGTVTGTTRYNVDAVVVAANGGQTTTGLTTVVVTVVTRAAADLSVGYVVNVATVGAREAVDTKALAGAAGDATSAVSVTGRAVVTGDRGVPYASVTVAGAGLFVLVDGVYAAAPAAVTADADGYFTATVRSNKSGTIAGTVASGSAAAVAFNVLVSAPLAVNATATATPNDAVSTLLVGRTATVTFSARDVFGNQVVSAFDNTNTLTARVSGDRTVDVVYADTATGYLTIAGLAPAANATGTLYYTVTLSTSTRLVTQQVRIDWAKETVTVDAPEAAVAGQNVDIVVTVLDPNGDPIKDYKVTATSTGVGNLTVASATTDANGQAYLKLFAAAGELGWAYVTATSTTGNVVADVAQVSFEAAPTATDNVATLTLEAPASAQAGTVVDVVATATDADGNAVAGAVVSGTSTGVGYLAVAGGTTDANGKVTLKLVVTAGENGAASVSATAGSVSADAASITAGATDANISINKKRVTIDWSFAANKKVVIVRDGAVIKSFTASSNAADSFSFNLKKGTHKVSVKVGGVTLDSASYKIAK